MQKASSNVVFCSETEKVVSNPVASAAMESRESVDILLSYDKKLKDTLSSASWEDFDPFLQSGICAGMVCAGVLCTAKLRPVRGALIGSSLVGGGVYGCAFLWYGGRFSSRAERWQLFQYKLCIGSAAGLAAGSVAYGGTKTMELTGLSKKLGKLAPILVTGASYATRAATVNYMTGAAVSKGVAGAFSRGLISGCAGIIGSEIANQTVSSVAPPPDMDIVRLAIAEKAFVRSVGAFVAAGSTTGVQTLIKGGTWEQAVGTAIQNSLWGGLLGTSAALGGALRELQNAELSSSVQTSVSATQSAADSVDIPDIDVSE